MKIPYFFIVLFAAIFQVVISNSLLAMEEKSPRRSVNYESPEAYIGSFKEGNNTGKPKILFIGAGLAYDDLVKGSETKIVKIDIKEKYREKYYPTNAYLIDLDGKFFNPLTYESTDLSLSDFQSDIQKEIGSSEDTLPKVFTSEFDYIILENLVFECMTGDAFKNLYSLLKKEGKIISNAFFEVEIADAKKIEEVRNFRAEFALLDEYKNGIIELYYPSEWADDNESLLENYTFIVSPIDSEDDKAYKELLESGKEPKIISFENFDNLYKSNQIYRDFIFKEIREVYKYNILEYFKALLPNASLSFSMAEELWSAAPCKFGYFAITRPN